MSKLYFIQAGDDGPIKIGHSANPRERLAMLQVGNPRELVLLAEIDYSAGNLGERTAAYQEELFHRTFRIARIRGEWFEPHPTILWAIECLKNGTPFEVEPLQ